MQNKEQAGAIQINTIDRVECTRLWVIRKGYISYAHDETRSAAIASKYPILQRV